MRKASTPASAATNREAFYAQRRRIRSETKLEIVCRQQILEYFCEVSCNRDLADRIGALATHDPKSGCATAVISRNEIDAAAERLGVPFSAEYREFISLYGGGHAGSLPVAGLRRWEAAGNREWSVIELTEWHRTAKWPGTDLWAVAEGYVSLTPLHLDLTNHRALVQLGDWQGSLNAQFLTEPGRSPRRAPTAPATPKRKPRRCNG